MSVIVGVDGSESAARAAETAARIAVALGTDLLVVSAFSPNAADRDEVADEVLTTREVAEQLASEAAEPLRATYPGLSIAADAEPGRPADALVFAAEQASAELIVIGNKRVQGVSRLLGSVAVDVVRRAPCDVYIAHTHG